MLIRLAFSVPGYATAKATSDFELRSSLRDVVFSRLSNLFEGVAGGAYRTASGQTAPSLIVSIDGNTVAAAGTVTCVTVANNSTVVIGNQTLTGKTSAPSGQNQWLCGVSADADGTALAACINAHTVLSNYMSAVNVSGVVTITMKNSALGVIGNMFKFTSSDGTNLAVVVFAAGADDATSKTYSF